MSVDFSKLLRDPRDVAAPPGSVNAELLSLPQQRVYTDDMKGKLLYFPRTDQVLVPYHLSSGGGYEAVVVHNGPRAPRKEDGSFMYTPGGYNLWVSDLEMQTAIEFGAQDVFHVTVYIRGDRERDVDMTPSPWAEGGNTLESARKIAALNIREGHTVEIHQETTFDAGDWWEVPA